MNKESWIVSLLRGLPKQHSQTTITENTKFIFWLQLKTFIKDGVAAEIFTEEERMKSFENQDNQKARLALLQNYINEQLQLIHKLAAGTPEKQVRKPKNPQHPANLIDPREAWKCGLCSGNHKDDKG